MYLKVTYEQDFYDLMMWLKAKYPQKLFDMDGIGKQTDMSMFSKDFFSNKSVASDVSIDANANVDDMSVIAYDKELPKPFFRLNSYYVLWKKMRQLYGKPKANDIIEKQLSGDIYINDFHGIGAGKPYCFNYSTYDIMLTGLPMVQKIKSVAPKYLYSFKSQLEQFVTVASNSTLGATGLADMLIVMSLYVQRILHTKQDVHFSFASEEDVWKYVEANIESFIYTINQPMRGNQSPFTNVSVYDDGFLATLCPEYVWAYEFEGEQYDIAADPELVKRLQVIYLDIMNTELRRTPITFPVTTACFSLDDDRNINDEAFLAMIAEKNKEFGFINIYSGKTSTLSSCCRLRSDTENEYFNSFGSGSSKIGSLGVCTINFPRLAWKSEGNVEKFLASIEELVQDSQDVNNAKRHIVQKRIDNGNHPLYSLGFMALSKQYSTVGVNGLYEAVQIMGHDIMTKEGQEFTLRVLKTINEYNDKLQKKYNAPHNVEQIPAENVAIKLAEKDRLLKFNDVYDIYSNQFIPLVVKADLLDRIELQGLFDSHFSGGAIAHLNVETRIDDTAVIANLIRHAAKKGVVYFAINYSIKECENGHMSIGKAITACTTCGGEITGEYSRVVGFLTKVSCWHKVRREQDWPNRVFEDKTQLEEKMRATTDAAA
jgi:anaerobic ribonucleoside-triphosphate reductase